MKSHNAVRVDPTPPTFTDPAVPPYLPPRRQVQTTKPVGVTTAIKRFITNVGRHADRRDGAAMGQHNTTTKAAGQR